MKPQRFYSRANREDLEWLNKSFEKGIWFVERKSDNKWLTAFVNPDTLKEEDWTNDPLKAMSWSSKPMAELEIIRMKLGDSAIVTEHEFVEQKHFISASCEGEKCFCGKSATHKLGEEIPHDDPLPARHNLTAYVCCDHFRMILGKSAC